VSDQSRPSAATISTLQAHLPGAAAWGAAAGFLARHGSARRLAAFEKRALAATGRRMSRFVLRLAGSAVGMGGLAAARDAGGIESYCWTIFSFRDAAARPYRTHAGIEGWGLPYPSEPG